MKTIAGAVTVLVVLWSVPGHAQAPAAGTEKPAITRQIVLNDMVTLGTTAARAGAPDPFQNVFGGGGRGLVGAYVIAMHTEREGYAALLQALQARAIKQVGAAPSNKGTTSLAMKGLAPEILGLAVETGALTREVDGTTLTFRATPMSVFKALRDQGLIDIYSDYSVKKFQRYASRLSLAASFDASKGPSAGTFAADKHQLTAWSIHAELLNQRDPGSPEYAQLWKDVLQNSASYLNARTVFDQQLSLWPQYVAWEAQVRADAARLVELPFKVNGDVDAAGARFRALLETALPLLQKLPGTPDAALKALDAYVAQLTTLQSRLNEVYDFAAKGNLVTFDWTTSRDAALPDLYAATAIWEHALGASRKTNLTVNGAANFYRNKPSAEAKQLKSIDLTAQLDHPLGSTFVLPKATLTLAGRFTRIPNDTVSSAPVGDAVTPAPAAATTVAAPSPKGNMFVVQLKVTVPVKNSGIKVPLSISASNRSELIKEKDVRANFGITFDLDTIIGGVLGR